MRGMDSTLIWDGWEPVVHSAVMVVCGFIALVLILRVSGPRTMAKMTPLDFIVAVTIGSAFGRTLTATSVPLAQTVLVLALLVGIQWVFAAARAKSRRVRALLDNPPVLLYYQGRIQDRALRSHRLLEEDVHTAARQSGKGSLEQVAAVILQQDGSLGVIGRDDLGDASSLLPYTGRADIHHNEG
ncbi:uncharacterized protein DUF421 [Dietzia psychralcaliphila]|nr:uncharacterized protein DUF421 [Dietzia psychralcaliphila]